jgi:predicted XRE-type DNA-binding protein
MPSVKAANEPGHITTGNIMEELGFSPEEIREADIKCDIYLPIRDEIEARKLTQAQLAKLLDIHQPDASLLLRGQIERFSITRLLQFADRLQLAVTISVAPMSETQKPRNSTRIPLRKTGLRKPPTKPVALPRMARRAASA